MALFSSESVNVLFTVHHIAAIAQPVYTHTRTHLYKKLIRDEQLFHRQATAQIAAALQAIDWD